MDNMIIYALIIFIGACMAVLVPYLLNRWKDPATTVNWAYVAILFVSTIIAVLFGLPSKVGIIDVDAIKAAFSLGYMMQSVIGKIVKTIQENPTMDDQGK